MKEQRTEQENQDLVNQIYAFAADLLFKQHRTIKDVKNILAEKGLNAEDANIIVSNLQQQMKEAKSKAANKNMLYGALWCIGGLLVTAVTYSNAAREGGTYIVTWGAIIFGAIQFLSGLYQKITA
ncbi:hypothetical protein AB9N12_18045 [Bacteroides sp. AN502(2024)]|uniref:hypothetical protein n=1 Tax=Bacteroides sp. AN502(2024) TaxID=3160599 RepID=UPI0035123EE8